MFKVLDDQRKGSANNDGDYGSRQRFEIFVCAGAKDLHVQDLKRHDKLDGVLGVNLGSGLPAGGGLTLPQELIMTMPGAGSFER